MKLQGDLTLARRGFRLETGPFALALDGVTALFGPSGSGKTTLLRCLAGLEPDVRGQLAADGQTWQDGRRRRSPARRDIGFVFQDAALFPHQTLRGNLDYAHRRAPAGGPDVPTVAARVGIEHRLDAAVHTLSGGERQRTALARALLSRPRLLCLDEPLSALDWQARAALLDLIDDLARRTDLPMIYVTHNPREVERLARQVAFMQDGRLTRIDSLADALARPDSALFQPPDGAASVLAGTLGPAGADGLQPFTTPGGVVLRLVPAGHDGRQRRLRILARDVSLARTEPAGISMLNRLPVQLTQLHPLDEHRVLATLRLTDGQMLMAEITAYSMRELDLAPGQSLYALVKSVALID